MYTDTAPQIKPLHFIATYQLCDLFTSKGLDNLTKIGCTVVEDADEDMFSDDIYVNGVAHTISDEAGMIQCCETDVQDGELEDMFQFSNTAKIELCDSSAYRGQGNYEAIVHQNDKVYLLDIVSEGMAYVLEPVGA